MTGSEPDPLIVTMEADAASQARFDAARKRWFPPARNIVPAHVTLFHRLAGDRVDAVALRLSQVARDMVPPAFRVASVMALGKGAAYRLDLPAGDRLRRAIGGGFEIAAQDNGRLRAHVTVQNKVSPEEAAATLDLLRADLHALGGAGHRSAALVVSRRALGAGRPVRVRRRSRQGLTVLGQRRWRCPVETGGCFAHAQQARRRHPSCPHVTVAEEVPRSQRPDGERPSKKPPTSVRRSDRNRCIAPCRESSGAVSILARRHPEEGADKVDLTVDARWLVRDMSVLDGPDRLPRARSGERFAGSGQSFQRGGSALDAVGIRASGNAGTGLLLPAENRGPIHDPARRRRIGDIPAGKRKPAVPAHGEQDPPRGNRCPPNGPRAADKPLPFRDQRSSALHNQSGTQRFLAIYEIALSGGEAPVSAGRSTSASGGAGSSATGGIAAPMFPAPSSTSGPVSGVS